MTPASSPAAPWLSARDLGRSYGPIRALSGVSIDFLPGEIHAIVGENGAGKSTLMRLIAAEEMPHAGEILIRGRPATLSGPRAAREAGIAVVHQHFQLVDTLTVAENMSLGRLPTRFRVGSFGVVDRSRMRREAALRLDPFGLAPKVDEQVRDLTVAERQLVEIARAMDGEARLLLLDEPTASLGAAETRELFRHVIALREAGASVVLIAHNLDEVLSVADRITVLRNGQLVATVPREEVEYGTLVQMMVGRELARGYPKAAIEPGEARLEADALLRSEGRPLPLAVRSGEILGIPTFVGAAVDRLLGRLSGTASDAAPIRLDGRELRRGGLRPRIEAGLSVIPGDTMREGLVPALSIEENILLPNLARFSRGGAIRRGALRREVERLIAELDIRPADPTARVDRLSGGNRQKVVIAKWLARGSKVFLMNDPTKAVDVGAKAEIYRLLGDVVTEGGSVVLVSSDLDELIGLSDRVVVLNGPDMVGEFRPPIGKEHLLAAMVGSRHAAAAGAALR